MPNCLSVTLLLLSGFAVSCAPTYCVVISNVDDAPLTIVLESPDQGILVEDQLAPGRSRYLLYTPSEESGLLLTVSRDGSTVLEQTIGYFPTTYHGKSSMTVRIDSGGMQKGDSPYCPL